MQSEQTRGILDQAIAGRREHPHGTKPWLVANHPEWCKGKDHEKITKPHEQEEHVGGKTSMIEDSRTIDSFQCYKGRTRNDDHDEGEPLDSDEVAGGEVRTRILAEWRRAHPELYTKSDEKTGSIKVPPLHSSYLFTKRSTVAAPQTSIVRLMVFIGQSSRSSKSSIQHRATDINPSWQDGLYGSVSRK